MMFWFRSIVMLIEDMAHGDFKDLFKKKASDKELRDKTFNFATNLKYDGCQQGLALTV